MVGWRIRIGNGRGEIYELYELKAKKKQRSSPIFYAVLLQFVCECGRGAIDCDCINIFYNKIDYLQDYVIYS